VSKSSQIGLHVWLPLMVPTPVSALINAATMRIQQGLSINAERSPVLEYSLNSVNNLFMNR